MQKFSIFKFNEKFVHFVHLYIIRFHNVQACLLTLKTSLRSDCSQCDKHLMYIHMNYMFYSSEPSFFFFNCFDYQSTHQLTKFNNNNKKEHTQKCRAKKLAKTRTTNDITRERDNQNSATNKRLNHIQSISI